MRNKGIIGFLLAACLGAGAFAGCSDAGSANAPSPASEGGSQASQQAEPAASGETMQVEFWTAPQQVQYNYWDEQAIQFNQLGAQVGGKTVQIVVQQMPESPSSEAGIQNAIVTGTIPAASENITRGFAMTLANSDAIYELQDEDWFHDIVANRHMEGTMKGWAVDGKQYVMPEYNNVRMWQWNSRALKALGYDAPPTTEAEFEAVLKAFVDNRDKMNEIGVTHTFYNSNIMQPEKWYHRWNDFQITYMNLTGKTDWVVGDQLVLDRAGSIEAFEWIGKFGNTIQTESLTDTWNHENTSVLVSINAPHDAQALRERNVEYGMDGDYIQGPPIVKNAGDPVYCFADTKGIVLYKNSSISEDQHQGMVEFMKWLYSAENNEATDLAWLAATTMLPARDDLVENAAFADFMQEWPELAATAEYMGTSVPCMASEKMTEIQQALGEYGLTPYVETLSSAEPLTKVDASQYVDAAFDAMIKAGNLHQ